MADPRILPVAGETASNRMAQAQRSFRAKPPEGRSLNEMKKGGKVTFRKKKAKHHGKG